MLIGLNLLSLLSRCRWPPPCATHLSMACDLGNLMRHNILCMLQVLSVAVRLMSAHFQAVSLRRPVAGAASRGIPARRRQRIDLHAVARLAAQRRRLLQQWQRIDDSGGYSRHGSPTLTCSAAVRCNTAFGYTRCTGAVTLGAHTASQHRVLLHELRAGRGDIAS